MTIKGDAWKTRTYSRSFEKGWDHYISAKSLKNTEDCDSLEEKEKVETTDEIEDSFRHP